MDSGVPELSIDSYSVEDLVQRRLIRITLKSGNLQIWSTFSQQWSHPINELRSAKQDPPLHAIPDWNAEAFHYELAIRSPGTNEILIEMREYPICSQELRRLNFSGRGTVAAPLILPWMTYSSGTDRVEHDVSSELKKMTLLLDKNPQRIEFCKNSKELDFRVPSAYSPVRGSL